MRTLIAAFLLLMMVGVPALRAQVEPAGGRTASDQGDESIDSNDPAVVDTATNSTNTPSVTTTSSTLHATMPTAAPGWIHLVRLAAMAGPVAFLLLAWMIGAIVHYRLVRREQEQFPVIRGSRTPQTTPMIISAALFFIPVLLFVLFEIRSRQEIRRGIGGIVDEWQPVTAHAWTTLVICLVLALVPWLFARRADTVT
jgi:hypothetical protein